MTASVRTDGGEGPELVVTVETDPDSLVDSADPPPVGVPGARDQGRADPDGDGEDRD